MGSSDFIGYCSFTKAIEHLGDRWSLLILRELGMFGEQGFNELANGLPGRISRSVLSERLHRLETLGLVSRADRRARQVPYRLTAAGAGLLPTILSLRGWAATWMPDDPEMVERDPDVVIAWLGKRVDSTRLPERRAVLEIRTGRREQLRYWLVLEREAVPYGCLEDPLLDEQRYVYAFTGPSVLLSLAAGRRAWADAIADGSVLLYGDPELTTELPGWFQSIDRAGLGSSPAAR
jgi:DNA-binding HxlR family transcriptional regulator